MSQNIDELLIDIQTQSKDVDNRLESLASSLYSMANAVSTIDTTTFDRLANGLERISASVKGLASTSSRSFESAITKIGSLSNLNTTAIAETATTLSTFAESFNSASQSVESITNLAQAIGTLGSVKVERALTNISQLGVAVKGMLQSLSDAPALNANVIASINSLSGLASQGQKVNTVYKNLTNSTKSLQSSNKDAEKSVVSLSDRFNRFMQTMYSIRGAINALKNAFRGIMKYGESAMDYVETYNFYTVALDKVSKESEKKYKKAGGKSAEAFYDEYSKQLAELNRKMTGFSLGKNGELLGDIDIGLGIDPEVLMGFQAQIMSITTSVGLLGSTTLSTTKALSMLSSDMSSLKNEDLDVVMNKFSSALVGNSRAVKNFGMDITNATLQEYAYANGISKAVSEMTQAEKMQLRVLAMVDQARIAWADQSNTLNSVANQYRIFKQQIANLGRTIGNLFLPIVQKVLPYLNAFVILLRKLFETLGFKLFGAEWLTDLQDGISGGVGDLGEDVDDLSDSLDDASGSAKKLKTNLLGIDELNVLNQDDSSGMLGKFGTGFNLDSAIADALAEYEKVWNEAFENAKNKASEIANAIINALARFFEHTDEVKKNFKEIEENIDRIGKSWGKVFSSPEVQDSLERFREQSYNTAKGIKDAFETVTTNFTVGLTGGIADASEDLEEFNTTKISSIIDNFTRLSGVVEKVADALGVVSRVFKSDGFKKIVEIATKIIDIGILQWLDDFSGQMADLADLITSPWTENAGKIEEFLEHLTDILADLMMPLEVVCDLVSQNAKKYEDGWLHKMFMSLKDFNIETVGKVFDKLNGALEKLEQHTSKFASAKSKIESAWGDGTIFDDIKANFDQVKESVSLAVSGIKENFANLPYDIGYALGEFVASLNNFVTVEIPKFITDTENSFSELPDKIKAKFDEVITKLGGWKDDFTAWVETDVPLMVENFVNGFLELPQKMYDFGKEIIDNFWLGITEKWSEFVANVGTLKDQLVEGFRNGFAQNTVDGYNAGVAENSESSQGTISTWFGNIKQWVHDSPLQFGSPSKTMYDFGVDTVKGYSNGITESFKDAKNVINNFTTNVLMAFKAKSQEFFYTGQYLGNNVAQGLLNGLNSRTGEILGWANSVASQIASAFSSAMQVHSPSRVMYKLGAYVTEGLQLGMESMYGTTLDSFRGFTSNIANVPNQSFTIDSNTSYNDRYSSFEDTVSNRTNETVTSMLLPYLSQIATNTRESAQKELQVNIGDRQIARANARGTALLGRQLITV